MLFRSQLDAIGLWVGITRQVQTPITGVYFSLDTAGLGFDQGNWQGPYDPSYGITSLDDTTFRAAIRIKIGINTWDGTLPSYQAILNNALASMGGMTSQPCLNSIVAALRHTPRETGLDQVALDDLSRYWAGVRELYYPFEEGLKAPGPDVYQHEMPGGQYTNLRQQSKSLGLDQRWPEVCQAYATANQLVGDIEIGRAHV